MIVNIFKLKHKHPTSDIFSRNLTQMEGYCNKCDKLTRMINEGDIWRCSECGTRKKFARTL